MNVWRSKLQRNPLSRKLQIQSFWITGPTSVEAAMVLKLNMSSTIALDAVESVYDICEDKETSFVWEIYLAPSIFLGMLDSKGGHTRRDLLVWQCLQMSGTLPDMPTYGDWIITMGKREVGSRDHINEQMQFTSHVWSTSGWLSGRYRSGKTIRGPHTRANKLLTWSVGRFYRAVFGSLYSSRANASCALNLKAIVTKCTNMRAEICSMCLYPGWRSASGCRLGTNILGYVRTGCCQSVVIFERNRSVQCPIPLIWIRSACVRSYTDLSFSSKADQIQINGVGALNRYLLLSA